MPASLRESTWDPRNPPDALFIHSLPLPAPSFILHILRLGRILKRRVLCLSRFAYPSAPPDGPLTHFPCALLPFATSPPFPLIHPRANPLLAHARSMIIPLSLDSEYRPMPSRNRSPRVCMQNSTILDEYSTFRSYRINVSCWWPVPGTWRRITAILAYNRNTAIEQGKILCTHIVAYRKGFILQEIQIRTAECALLDWQSTETRVRFIFVRQRVLG